MLTLLDINKHSTDIQKQVRYMEKKVRVFVKSSQQYEDYADQINTNSIGIYNIQSGQHVINYEEKIEGGNIVCNTLTLSEEKAELIRSGAVTSQMLFQKGKTVNTEYATIYGKVNFIVNTSRYQTNFDNNQLNTLIQYDLLHNGVKVSTNILQISIEIEQ